MATKKIKSRNRKSRNRNRSRQSRNKSRNGGGCLFSSKVVHPTDAEGKVLFHTDETNE